MYGFFVQNGMGYDGFLEFLCERAWWAEKKYGLYIYVTVITGCGV